MIRRLLLVRTVAHPDPSQEPIRLAEFRLMSDATQQAQLMRLREVFPDLETDTAQSEAALAFLLARHGLSCAVAFGPGYSPGFLNGDRFADTPIAFDYSHTDHFLGQNVMWSRLSMAIDGLITLLKEAPQGSGSMWDHSLIYVATDFGRTKERPAANAQGGSGHHLNNGALFISPMLKANRVYGGVDPMTGLTYGFDPISGEPDPHRLMGSEHLYSLIAQVMDIDFPDRRDMRGLIR